MENVTWSFIVPIYPVNFAQITQFVLKYVAGYVNKFVPDLHGILTDYDKKSLRIFTSIDSDLSFRYYTLFRITPELNYLRIRGSINTSVFCPKEGLELDATVSTIRPYVVICRTNISNITVSLCYPDANNNLESVNNGTSKIFNLKLNDKVRIKLSYVAQNLGTFIIRGELVDIISKSSVFKDSKVKKFDDFSSDEEISSTNNCNLESNLESYSHSEITFANEDNEYNSRKSLKRCFDADEVCEEANDSEAVLSPKKKRKKSKHKLLSPIFKCKEEPL